MMKKLLFFILLSVSQFVVSQNEFITTWETTTANETITIPTIGSGYNYDIDWENDSTFDDIGITGNITHTFVSPGIHTIAIQGDFPHIYFNNSGDKSKIKSIEQWGNIAWGSFSHAFSGCSFLVINATDAPNLSNVTQMDWMFRYCSSFNQSIEHWNMSNVTNITGMFAQSSYNQPLENWDVSNIRFMGTLFYRTPFNQPLNNWNVGNVENMSFMFTEASAFNRRLNGWNVGSLIFANDMFTLATSFDQPLNNWDVSSVVSMRSMFYGATSFNQTIGDWDVSSVTDMTNMFFNVTLSTANYDDILIGWDALSLQSNVNFHGGNSLFCNAATQRTNMINNDGWIITDGGQTICGSLSTDEFDEIIFLIYPNPTNSHFSIETKHLINNISVVDLQGKTVKSFKENLAFYDVEDLTSGLYFVSIETEKGKTTKKLIKE